MHTHYCLMVIIGSKVVFEQNWCFGIWIYGLVDKKGALVFQVTLFKETNNILITDHEIKEHQKEVYSWYKPIQISLLMYLFNFYCTFSESDTLHHNNICTAIFFYILILSNTLYWAMNKYLFNIKSLDRHFCCALLNTLNLP